MRHIQGVATFEDELRLGFWRRMGMTLREEGYVWLKSVAVAPLGTFVIAFGWVAMAILFTFFLATVLSPLRIAI